MLTHQPSRCWSGRDDVGLTDVTFDIRSASTINLTGRCRFTAGPPSATQFIRRPHATQPLHDLGCYDAFIWRREFPAFSCLSPGYQYSPDACVQSNSFGLLSTTYRSSTGIRAFPLDIFPGHIPSRTIPSPFTWCRWCRTFLPFNHHH